MNVKELMNEATELKQDEFAFVYNCVVLAPHHDDESLGCGGLIALLRSKGKEVNVIFITDGSLSHPGSAKYPAEALSALRKEEAIAALAVLKVPKANVFFLDKKDGSLPAESEPEFKRNANQLHLLLSLLQPDLVLVPYEKDPHRDHRATWQMLMFPNKIIGFEYRILEYIIWLQERGNEDEMPDKSSIRFVDISRWQLLKDDAIRKHISQTTRLIDDDPQGFILSPEVLSHFSTSKEYYIDRYL